MGEHLTRGRPLASSPEMLQEAALELFVEQTYAKTTIEEITQRAGVSRATFFNYFPAKSDVFWVDLDDALRRLSGVLGDHQSVEQTPTVGLLVVLQGLCAVAREMGEGRVPLALTQHELMGSVHELQSSALTRFSNQATIMSEFLQGFGFSAPRARAAAYASIATAIAATQEWAEAGTSRHPLDTYLREALEPVVQGFAQE